MRGSDDPVRSDEGASAIHAVEDLVRNLFYRDLSTSHYPPLELRIRREENIEINNILVKNLIIISCVLQFFVVLIIMHPNNVHRRSFK